VSAFPVASVAIIGSGPTAWLAAATLARVLRGSCAVQVIETDSDDATWGAVASVPSLHRLLRLLELDEVMLMRAGEATYRLGAEFRDWGAIGEHYFAGFGALARASMPCRFSTTGCVRTAPERARRSKISRWRRRRRAPADSNCRDPTRVRFCRHTRTPGISIRHD
jgi:hypothetical protein